QHGHPSERPRNLERASDATPGDRVRRESVEPIGAETDLAAVGGCEAGDHVEERRLARAVRPDEPGDRTLADGERAAGERFDAAEAFGDAGDGQEWSRGRFPPRVCDRRVSYVMPWDPRIEPWLERYPALRAIGQTPLVPVDVFRDELPGVEVFAKMEFLNPGGSLKDRPVLRMLLGALADERLRRGQTILDSSSGNAGIAYAMIGRVIGVPVEIVVPDNASAERKKRMRAHGARLVTTDALLGYDEALREVHRRAKTEPDRYFFCDQYSNGDN